MYKYRIKRIKPEYFSDFRYIPQRKHKWWPFWFSGPSVSSLDKAYDVIDNWKGNIYKETYFDV